MGKRIITSAKAVIIKDGKILTIRKKDEFGEYYVLPGGKQKKYENIMEALKRECMEEVNLEVIPEKIRNKKVTRWVWICFHTHYFFFLKSFLHR